MVVILVTSRETGLTRLSYRSKSTSTGTRVPIRYPVQYCTGSLSSLSQFTVQYTYVGKYRRTGDIGMQNSQVLVLR